MPAQAIDPAVSVGVAVAVFALLRGIRAVNRALASRGERPRDLADEVLPAAAATREMRALVRAATDTTLTGSRS